MLVWSSPFEKHGEHSLDTVKFPDSAPALHSDPCYVTHTHTHTHTHLTALFLGLPR